jgi:hypothetical protein
MWSVEVEWILGLLNGQPNLDRPPTSHPFLAKSKTCESRSSHVEGNSTTSFTSAIFAWLELSRSSVITLLRE